MGEVPQDMYKGPGLQLGEQVTPADAVLAKDNVDEICFVFHCHQNQILIHFV